MFSVARDSVAKEQLGAQTTPPGALPHGAHTYAPKAVKLGNAEGGGYMGLGREEHKGNPPLIPPSAEIGRARALAPANGRVPGRAWKTTVQAI